MQKSDDARRRILLLPILGGLGGIAITLWISWMLLQNEQRFMREYARASTVALRRFVKSNIDLRILAVQNFAKRWAVEDSALHDVWSDEANRLIKDIDGLESIEWIREDGELQWRMPESVNGPSSLSLLRDSRDLSVPLSRFRGSPPVISDPTDLAMGGRGFLYICPIVDNGRSLGYIVAVFRYRELFDSILRDVSREFRIQIFQHPANRVENVYEYIASGATNPNVKEQSAFTALNSSWMLVLQPTQSAISNRTGQSSTWVFLIGVCVSLLFAIRMRTTMLTADAARRAEDTLDSLRRETTRREKSEKTFRQIVEATSQVTGESFGNALVQALASALDVPICFLCVLSMDKPDVITITNLTVDGGLVPPVDKRMANTPFDVVVKNGSAFFTNSVQSAFPDDLLLQQLNAESYYAFALSDSSGHFITLLGIVDRQPMEENPLTQYLISLFAGRATAELQTLRAKEALSRSERVYRDAIENAAGVPYIHIYETQTYDFIGKGVEQLLGFSAEIITPAHLVNRVLEIQVNDPLSKNPKDYGIRFRSGEFKNYRADFRYLHPSGEERWISDSSVLLKDELTGRPYGDLGVMQDITTRKKSDEALHQHSQEISEWKRRYDAAVEASRQVLYDWDSQTSTITWGNFFESTFGYGPTEMRARRSWWESLVHPDDIVAYRETIMEALMNRSPFRTQYRVRRSDGSYIHIEDSGSFFLTPDGKLDRLVGFISDVTPRIMAEDQRRVLESKIQQAQKLESLGILAGGIAHDFNNLLVAILGNAGLALMELKAEAPARPIIESIEKAAQRAADLANQMLAYSGKGRFVIHQLDLNAIVEEMTHLLEISISKKAVLRYKLHEQLSPVDGDATQIRQIIMNLVTNASDSIGDRSGFITITTGMVNVDSSYMRQMILDAELEEGDYVFVEVSDTGCGMDAQTQAKIFEPFFTTKITGRGLGLAALLGIVRGHRGGVKVYSEPNQGTTIRILLRVSSSPSLPSEVLRASTQGTEQNDLVVRGGLVLVADDEETVRTVARLILEKAGFEVITASNGQEAVQMFQAHSDRIQIVLMDMTMPHMDGSEAYREMRRLKDDVCVILSSGYNEQEAINRFSGKGLAGFIQKPYRPADLIEKIREILSTRRQSV